MTFFSQFETSLKKGQIQIYSSKGNACEKAKGNDFVKISLALAGILSSQCPIESDTMKCYHNEKITSLSNIIKKLLPAASRKDNLYNLSVDVSHDTGFSCIKCEFVLVNKTSNIITL